MELEKEKKEAKRIEEMLKYNQLIAEPTGS